MNPGTGHKTLDWIEKKSAWFLGGIISLGFVLRIILLEDRGIWYDDAFSILLSQRSLSEIIQGTAADTMPPLSYFALHYWMQVGKSIAFIRLLNVLLGLFVIWLVYQFGNEISGKQAGLLGAFLTAISPFQILHAQEIRMYILLEIGLIGSSLDIYRIWKKKEKSGADWFWYIIFGLIAFYSHNLAIFSLIFVNFFFLVRREYKLLLRTILAQAVIFVGFAPWLWMVPGQIEKIQTAFWTPRPGLVEILQAMDTLLGSLPQPVWLTAVVTILSLQAVVMLFWLAYRQRHSENVQFLLILICFPGILLFIASYLIRPVFVPRAMIASSVGFYLLAAISASTNGFIPEDKITRKDAAPWIVIGLLVILSIISLPNQFVYHDFPRSRFRELSDYLTRECPIESCIVVHDNKLSYFPTVVYKPTENQIFLADEPGSFNDTLALQTQKALQMMARKDLEPEISGYPTVFFVTFEKAEEEYKTMGGMSHPVLDLLASLRYQMQEKTSIGDINIYEYER